MNNQSPNFTKSHGKHISESDRRSDQSVGSSSHDWTNPIWYASPKILCGPVCSLRLGGGVTDALSAHHFRPTNVNTASLQPGCIWDPPHYCQHGDWNNHAALDMSQPGDPFFNAGSVSGFIGPVYGELQPGFDYNECGSQHLYQGVGLVDDSSRNMSQPGSFMVPLYEKPQPGLNHWEIDSLGTEPSGALGMDLDLLPNMPGIPYMNGTQFEPAVPPTTVPAPNAIAPLTVNDDSFRCDICNRTFGRPQELRRHVGKHRSPKYKCVFYDCNKTFYRADKLRDHLKQGHKSINPLQALLD